MTAAVVTEVGRKTQKTRAVDKSAALFVPYATCIVVSVDSSRTRDPADTSARGRNGTRKASV